MQLDSLSWFPGHMTKTRRMITAELGNVDAVCEILDARIPMSSRNPDVDELTAGKPRLIVLNRVDQADPEMTKKWAVYFRSLGCAVIETDAKQGGGVKQFSSAVRTLLRDKIASYEAKGQIGRVATPMGAYQVVGTTLKAAKAALGLTGNERMTPELQDRIGQWILQAQGTGAWEGYKGPRGSLPPGALPTDPQARGMAQNALSAPMQPPQQNALAPFTPTIAALDANSFMTPANAFRNYIGS